MNLTKRLMAVIMTIMMLVSVMPAALADSTTTETTSCDHSWSEVDWIQGDSPCGTQTGVRYCSKCDKEDTVTRYVDHTWSGWNTVEEATCQKEGTAQRECAECGKVETNTIPKANHSWTDWYWKNGATPACGESGVMMRSCSVCKATEENNMTIEHTFSDWSTAVPGTCITPATEKRACTKCGKEEERDGAMGDHSYGDWYTVEPGDCTHKGKEARTCSVCGNTITRETEDMGHEWGEWQIKKQATCQQVGRKERDCLKCGKSYDIEIEKLPHSFGAWKVIQEPAPGQVGIRRRTCSMCGGTETVEFYPEGTLRRGGDNDEDEVEKMQRALNDQGYDCGTPDGKFGKNTEKAVKAFQEANGFPVDGIAWPEVLRKLLGDDYNAPETPAAPEAPAAPETPVDGEVPAEGEVPTDGETPAMPEDPAAEATGISFSKKIANTPANGKYFAEGETINYSFMVFNYSENDIVDVEIWDPMKGSNEDACVTRVETIAVGGFTAASFTYTVTAEDVQKGFIINQAEVTWVDSATGAAGSVKSAEVTAITGGAAVEVPVIEPGDLSIIEVNCMKSVLTTPANGEYFVPGEMITFEVYLNYQGEAPLHDVIGIDPLMEANGGLYEFGNVAPNSHGGFMFEYIVTDMDAAAGKITNIALIEGYAENGDRVAGFSNPVIVPTGFAGEAPVGAAPAVEITKTVTSTPANKLCYKAGEVIKYTITYTNIGDTEISELVIYDVLNGVGDIASAELFGPGESRECYFEYTVTPSDVKKGYVANMAIGQYYIDGASQLVYSNVVSSDTDGNPNTSYRDTTEGSIDTVTLKSGAISEISTDGCYRKMTTWNGEAAEYDMYYCAAHSAVEQQADAIIAAAASDEAKQQAWEQVAALWLAETDALYNRIVASADGPAKAVVITERARFMADAAAYHAQLNVMYPDQPAYVAELMADMYRNKSVELCFEIHGAANGSTNSILYATRLDAVRGTAAVCGCEVTADDATGRKYTVHACREHALVMEMTYARLEGGNDESTWLDIRTMWEIELNGAYNDLYIEHGAQGGMAFLAEYAAFDAWLEAREDYLNHLYPDQPQLVAEIIVREIIERTFSLHTID